MYQNYPLALIIQLGYLGVLKNNVVFMWFSPQRKNNLLLEVAVTW